MPNSIVFTNDQNYQDIADAIRSKNGSETLYYPSEMAAAINALAVTGESLSYQEKTVTPTKAEQLIEADSGYNGLSSVTVEAIPGQYIIPSGTLSITQNGTTNVTTYASVNVNVDQGAAINNQNKSVTPTESEQTVSADSGYTGLGTVTVGAIDSYYIGSSIPEYDSTDVTITGAVVEGPSGGYWDEGFEVTIPSGTAGTPTATKGTVSNNSVAVTPSVTNTTGYITGSTINGTAVTVSASELVSGTKSITANGEGIDVTNYASVDVAVPVGSTINNQNKTVTPSTSEQSITADNGYTGLGTVTIEAIDTEIGHAVTNGILIPSNGKLFSSVIVNVSSINLSQDNNGYLVFNNGNSGVSHNLPSAYQELLYINGEANGAVIDTGIAPDNTTYANLKVKPIALTGEALFGTKGTGDNADWRLFNYGNKIYWDCYSSRIYNASFPLLQTKDLQISNNRVMDLTTGEILDVGAEISSFTISSNIFINGASTSLTTKSHWYYVQIFKNGTKVRDFIPCYRKNDNICGMYDLVTSVFYTSVGSGQFTAGSFIN